MVEIMLNNFWRRKWLNHFVKLQMFPAIIWLESLVWGEGGSGSDISLQAPNSKFEAKLESKGELSYWVFTQPIYFAFNNFHIMVLCHFFGRAYFFKQKYWFQINRFYPQ